MTLAVIVALACSQDTSAVSLPPKPPFVVGAVSERKMTVTAVECDSSMKDVTEMKVRLTASVLKPDGERTWTASIEPASKPGWEVSLRCDKNGHPLEALLEKGEDPTGFHRLLLFLRQPLWPPVSGAAPPAWSVALASPLPGSRAELDVSCSLTRTNGAPPVFRLEQKTGLLKLGSTAQAEVTSVLTIDGASGSVLRSVQTAELYADGMKNQVVTYDESAKP